ncbi:MAG TPA: efflux RND transporter periplasmic adaptor subunit [Candidatus Acidoferrales bacterium]|nr:efflux RND transporter periplasmic adaptor subunit [Candidatus Acidoferrales bacterium]
MAVLAAAAGVCAGCSRKAASADAPTPAMAVKFVVAQSASVPETTEYLAQLRSRHSATINPQVEGQVTKIFVASGDAVKAGQPLMQIDPLKQEATVGSQEATRASKEATVRLAQIQYERAEKLYAAGVNSKQDLDTAKTALDTAKADLESLEAQVRVERVQLHYFQVTSPMNGMVGDVPVRVGDRVTVSSVLTTVDQPGELEAYINIPVERSGDLRLGLAVDLLDPAGNVLTKTQITFLSPQVNPDTQSILVKAAVDNRKGQLRTAEVTRARVTWSRHEGPVVPVIAVTRINGQYFAFVAVDEGKGLVARQRLIRVGQVLGNDYAVLDGVKPGDRLIVSGAQALADGTPVVEAPAETAKP